MERLKTKSRHYRDAHSLVGAEPDTASTSTRPASPQVPSREQVDEASMETVHAGGRNDARTRDRASQEQVFLRLPHVLKAIGVGRSTVWRWCKEGYFPAPVRLGPRVVAWRASDVSEWAATRVNGQESTWSALRADVPVPADGCMNGPRRRPPRT